MHKKIVRYTGVALCLAAVIVLADYFALLGTSNKKILALSEIRFKALDEQTGAPIGKIHATCYRHQNHNACSVRDDAKQGVISVQFPVHKQQVNSWLFTQSEEFLMPADPNIKIMLIHNNYRKVVQDHNLHDIHLNSGQLIKVKMQAVPEKKTEIPDHE